MLAGLTNVPLIYLIETGLPTEVLEAVVTATHFVTLNRLPGETGPNALPVADDRIASRCNTLDLNIIRLALINHAGIKLERGYYGYDLGVPYCMKDGTCGLVGVQVKRAGADTSHNIFKMQARSHIVKCTNVQCGRNGGHRCNGCADEVELKTLFENQVSVILSLEDDSNIAVFSDDVEIKYHGNCSDVSKPILEGILTGQKGLSALALYRPKEKTGSFFRPLAQLNRPLNVESDVLLSTTLWDDRFYGLETIKIKKDTIIAFVPDGFIHRQYTLSTRGWLVFSAIFPNWKECVKIANELMDGPSLFRCHRSQDFEFRRKIAYDMSFSFVEYSDSLALYRGGSSHLDEIDTGDQCNLNVSVNDAYAYTESELLEMRTAKAKDQKDTDTSISKKRHRDHQ